MKAHIVPGLTLSEVALQPDPTRSPGLHLSNILGDINQALDPKRFGGDIEDAGEFILVGQVFEDVLAAALVARIPGWSKPGEFTVDGIAMSPDGFGDPGWDGIDEIKVTWMTQPDTPQDFCDEGKFAHYHRQAKGYCHALGVTRARFQVLFVCGTRRPTLPTFQVYGVEYSTEELETNWALVLQHGKDMGVLT